MSLHGRRLLNRICTAQASPGVSASEMTYIMSGGESNSTHSRRLEFRSFSCRFGAYIKSLIT